MKKQICRQLPHFIAVLATIALMCATSCKIKHKLVDTNSLTDKTKTQTADSAHVQASSSAVTQDNIKILKTDSGTFTETTKTDRETRFDSTGHKTAIIEHTEITRQMRGTIKTATQNSTRSTLAQKSDSTGTHKVSEQKNVKQKSRKTDTTLTPLYGWIFWGVAAVMILGFAVVLARKFNLI